MSRTINHLEHPPVIKKLEPAKIQSNVKKVEKQQLSQSQSKDFRTNLLYNKLSTTLQNQQHGAVGQSRNDYQKHHSLTVGGDQMSVLLLKENMEKRKVLKSLSRVHE